jgi:hypothetical protein
MKITFSSNLSVATLTKATRLAEEIENKQAALAALLNGQTATRGKSVKKASRKFSDAQRAKISAGLKAKWLERKANAAKNPSSTPAAPAQS